MSHKILVVDDEPSIVIPLRFLMEQNGYDVAVATTGDEAVQAIREYHPDLILLDIMLPTADGFEVCQFVRDSPDRRDTKIIFLTAMGREIDVAKGLAIGADAYITKPFANSEVLAKIKELLG